jgi:peptidoglycan/xylan/chitin deacetylase (PgdA/CDA1 family)
VEFFRDRFTVVSLGEAVRLLHRHDGRLRAPCLAITFDDAYRSVARRALPILRHWQLPACLFVCDDPAAERRGLWRTRLALLMAAAPAALSARLRADVAGAPEHPRALFDYAKNRFSVRLRDAIDDLWTEQNLGREDLSPFMTYAECRALDPEQFEFGSHTIRHPVLAALSGDEQRQEVVEGHRRVEEGLGRRLSFFSYPFGGRAHWGEPAERAMQTLDGVYAVTADGGINRYLYPHHIRRIGWTAEPVDELARRLRGEAATLA